MSRHLLILGWHSVESTWSLGAASPEEGRRGFERQLRLLRRFANVLPLRQAMEELALGKPLPPRSVALTFDDGYLDNATVAAPMLRDAGMPATFFLVPGFLSGTSRAWWEELAWSLTRTFVAELWWEGQQYDLSRVRARRSSQRALADRLTSLGSAEREEAVREIRERLTPTGAMPDFGRLFMDWSDAERLARYGHGVGSHTCSHPMLSREDPETQTYELTESRRELEERLQRPVDVLAFPNGTANDYTDTTRLLLGQAGYVYALTTQPALACSDTPRDVLPRVIVGPQTDLRELLSRGFNGMARLAGARVRSRLGGGATAAGAGRR